MTLAGRENDDSGTPSCSGGRGGSATLGRGGRVTTSSNELAPACGSGSAGGAAAVADAASTCGNAGGGWGNAGAAAAAAGTGGRDGKEGNEGAELPADGNGGRPGTAGGALCSVGAPGRGGTGGRSGNGADIFQIRCKLERLRMSEVLWRKANDVAGDQVLQMRQRVRTDIVG